MQVTGLVTKLNLKHQSNAGKQFKSPMYSILIDDSVWYGFGFTNPNCQEGDVITFEAEQDGKWLNGDSSTVTVETGDAAKPAAKAAIQKADNKQESIVYQNSMGHAVQIVRLALDFDAVSLPSKKADRLPALEAMVQEVARNIAVVSIAPDYSSFNNDTEEGVPEDE